MYKHLYRERGGMLYLIHIFYNEVSKFRFHSDRNWFRSKSFITLVIAIGSCFGRYLTNKQMQTATHLHRNEKEKKNVDVR